MIDLTLCDSDTNPLFWLFIYFHLSIAQSFSGVCMQLISTVFLGGQTQTTPFHFVLI